MTFEEALRPRLKCEVRQGEFVNGLEQLMGTADASPANLLEEMSAALRIGALDAAADLGAALLEREPANAPALHLMASIDLRRQRNEDAMRWALRCLEVQPSHQPTLILAGHAARALGDLDGSLAFFRRAAELGPRSPDAVFMVCVVLLEQRNAEANTVLTDLLHRFPSHAKGWEEIGKTLHKLKKFEAALMAVTRAAEASPSAHRELHRASLMLALNRASDALQVLQHAAARFPDSRSVSLQLALVRHRLGRYSEARTELEALLADTPTDARAWFALGLVCQDAHDTAAAIAAYRRCLELRPDLAEAAVNLGICLQQAGDLAAAKKAYGDAMRVRDDTFGRIAQALPGAPKGELWLNPERLRQSLRG